MPGDSTVSCYDEHSDAYDAYQEAVVPGYHEMLDLVGEACKRYLKPHARIIDLGCGTGNASAAVLQRIPVEVFLLDGSEKMVAAAARKIGRARPEAVAGQRVADLCREDWDGGLERGAYDAVISALVLEHLQSDCYAVVIEKCFHLLKPGGWLLAAEGYREAESDMLEWFSDRMEDRRRALDPEISDRVARLRGEGEVHYYCSKAEKAGMWRKAGFQQVNTLWQYLCIALMAGRKPIYL